MLQPISVPGDYLFELLSIARRDPFFVECRRGGGDRVDVVLELVRDGAVEFAQPIFALIDLREREPEEMTHCCLSNELHRLAHSLPADEEVAPGVVSGN